MRRHLSRGGGTVSPAALSDTNDSTPVSTEHLAFDKYGYPYNDENGDETDIDHTDIEAKGEHWAYKIRTYSSGYVSRGLELWASFNQDLSGQTINCSVTAYCAGLKDVTFNGSVTLGGSATGCTFNSWTTLSDMTAGKPTITLTDCTLNYGLTNNAADGRLVNCNLYGDHAIACQSHEYGDNVQANNKLTILNTDTNVIEGRIYCRHGCSIVINGGYFTGGLNLEETGGNLEINGGIFDQGISVQNGTCTINGGTFTAQKTTGNVMVSGDNALVEINDGTFNGYVLVQSGTLNIKNGTFAKNVAAFSNGTGTLNITGGVFANEPMGASESSELYKVEAVEGATLNGLPSPVYVANQTATPRITLNYSGNTEHKILAWRIDIDNAAKNHISTDGTNLMTQYLLKQANYEHSDDLRTISLDCVRTIAGQGAFNADITVMPVLDILPSELTYTAPTAGQPASVTLGSEMPEEIEIVSHYTNTTTGETTNEYPTTPGTYQISVNLNSTNPPAEESVTSVFAHRLFWDGTYHQLPFTGQEPLTSDSWQFTIEAQKQPTINPDTGVPEGPTKGDGWSYDKKDDETTGTITTDKDKEIDLSEQPAVKADVDNNGTLTGGTFEGTVTNNGAINNGTFTGEVTGSGTINGGTFTGNITGNVTIIGGTFTGKVDDSVTVVAGVFTEKPENIDTGSQTSTVTVTGDSTINDTQNDTVTVVATEDNKPDVQLSAKVSGRDFYGWKAAEKDQAATLLDAEASTTVTPDIATDVTYTPIVRMDLSDLDTGTEEEPTSVDVLLSGVQVESLRYYELDETGAPTGEGFDSLPETAGTYRLFAVLTLTGNAAENSLALYAAEEKTLDRVVVEQNGVGYYVPEKLAIRDAKTVEPQDPDTPSSGSGDDGGMAIAALVGGAAIGAGAYYLGTTAYLKSVLPEGVAIPTNREQLAVVLWTAAGKPATESTAVFGDVAADSEDLTAIRWAVANGLLSADNDTFNPGKYVTRIEVIRTWNSFRQR